MKLRVKGNETLGALLELIQSLIRTETVREDHLSLKSTELCSWNRECKNCSFAISELSFIAAVYTPSESEATAM